MSNFKCLKVKSTISPRILNQLGHGHKLFLSGQGSIQYQKLSDKKSLCPILNASMYNITKNTKSAWTWT
jgi:hypothetical protein